MQGLLEASWLGEEGEEEKRKIRRRRFTFAVKLRFRVFINDYE